MLVGNQAAMAGGAVTADVADGSALYYNPAGLALIHTNKADITASAIGVRIYVAPGLVSSVSGASADESTVEILTIPSAVSYVRPISETVHLGLGIFVPQSSDLVLRSLVDTETATVNGSLQLVFADTSAAYDFTLGLGWAASPRFRVGVSAVVGYATTFSSFQFYVRTTTVDTDALGGLSSIASYKLFDLRLRAGIQ